MTMKIESMLKGSARGKTPSRTIFILILAAGLVACSDPAPTIAAVADPICAALVTRCHPFATRPGIAMDCHDLGEANDGTVCRTRQTECYAACAEHPDSGVTDASAADVLADAPSNDVTDVPIVDVPAVDVPRHH